MSELTRDELLLAKNALEYWYGDRSTGRADEHALWAPTLMLIGKLGYLTGTEEETDEWLANI